MKITSFLLTALLAGGLVGAQFPVTAHEGPEDEIEDLTQRIDRQRDTADLYLQRAIEYQVLGKYAEAAKDLEKTISLEPESLLAQRELGRSYFALGKTNEALQSVSRALEGISAGPERSALLIVRAEFLRLRKEHGKALEDANRAIADHSEIVEWYLFRSQLQRTLKLPKERIQGLEDGFKATGSGLLDFERVDALIDDGQNGPALERIEAELAATRWKSSWLIRRARVLFATEKPDEARKDLDAAIEELNGRMNVTTPDPFLLAQRGLARHLLGLAEEAKKDLEQARDKGYAEEWVLERIQTLPKSERSERPRRR